MLVPSYPSLTIENAVRCYYALALSLSLFMRHDSSDLVFLISLCERWDQELITPEKGGGLDQWFSLHALKKPTVSCRYFWNSENNIFATKKINIQTKEHINHPLKNICYILGFNARCHFEERVLLLKRLQICFSKIWIPELWVTSAQR